MTGKNPTPKTDLISQMAYMQAIAKVLKKHFSNLSAQQCIQISGEILIELNETHDV